MTKISGIRLNISGVLARILLIFPILNFGINPCMMLYGMTLYGISNTYHNTTTKHTHYSTTKLALLYYETRSTLLYSTTNYPLLLVNIGR